jgi:hypothetical protein
MEKTRNSKNQKVEKAPKCCETLIGGSYILQNNYPFIEGW